MNVSYLCTAKHVEKMIKKYALISAEWGYHVIHFSFHFLYPEKFNSEARLNIDARAILPMISQAQRCRCESRFMWHWTKYEPCIEHFLPLFLPLFWEPNRQTLNQSCKVSKRRNGRLLFLYGEFFAGFIQRQQSSWMSCLGELWGQKQVSLLC